MNTIAKKQISVKMQTVYALIATAAAVVLPQIFHLFGAVGGETFLPMHLPVLLVGSIAGSIAGGICGVLAPIVSFAISGMPAAALLPFMVIELSVYGIASGLLRNVKMPNVLKVLSAQVIGRAVRAAFILLAFYLGNSSVAPAIIVNSIVTGVYGIILQLILIPVILGIIERKTR